MPTLLTPVNNTTCQFCSSHHHLTTPPPFTTIFSSVFLLPYMIPLKSPHRLLLFLSPYTVFIQVSGHQHTPSSHRATSQKGDLLISCRCRPLLFPRWIAHTHIYIYIHTLDHLRSLPAWAFFLSKRSLPVGKTGGHARSFYSHLLPLLELG